MSHMSRSRDPVKDYVAGQMPDTIKRLLSLAKVDLEEGPLYLDKDGNRCSEFDNDAEPFDFNSACRKIRNFFEDIGCLYVDEDGCVHTSEPEGFTELEANPDFDPDDPESDEEVEVYYGPTPYWEVPRHRIIERLTGTLAPYI